MSTPRSCHYRRRKTPTSKFTIVFCILVSICLQKYDQQGGNASVKLFVEAQSSFSSDVVSEPLTTGAPNTATSSIAPSGDAAIDANGGADESTSAPSDIMMDDEATKKPKKNKKDKTSLGKCYRSVKKRCDCGDNNKDRRKVRKCLQRIVKRKCGLSKKEKGRIKNKFNNYCKKKTGRKPFKY